MASRVPLAVCSLLFLTDLLAAEPAPVLRLEGGGPTAQVTALAFSPDGDTLYAAGYDKVVRVWKRAGEQFQLQDRAYRVPIGPGTAGVINSLAVSPEGDWLAVGGLGLVQGEAGIAQDGRFFRIETPEIGGDRGLIYLFSLKAPATPPQLLRGHQGPVVALAFAPAGRPALLVSAAVEPGTKAGSFTGRLRAWDADRGTELAARDLCEVRTNTPPALAVSRTNPLRAAVAWGEGRFRTWDVAPNGGAAQDTADGAGEMNSTAILLPDGRLLTAAYDREGGRLQWWKDQPGKAPVALDALPLEHPDARFVQPAALALVSSKPARAAVVVSYPKEEGRAYSLGLVGLADRKEASWAHLWDMPDQYIHIPVLAASPDGRFVAVSHEAGPAIRVYTVADLREGKKRFQSLTSVGTAVRSLAFVQKEKATRLGLELTDSSGRKLVLDFADRNLVRDPKQPDWTAAGTSGDWKVKATGRAAFHWEGPTDAGDVTIPLTKNQVVTASLVLPPVAGTTKQPLLAVAAWDLFRGEPLLALYRTDGGAPVRFLRGHVQPIHALAASADGRLLASAASDQTICLWGLEDLNKIVGKQGMLTGVDLRQEKQGLTVAQVDPGSPAEGKLRVGDRITSLALEENARKPLAGLNALEFCDALWQVTPGKPIWLGIEGRTDPVKLTAGQGIDDRRPLFSLFLTAEKEQNPEWIAWAPTGAFDSRGSRVESYVGWHFNPAKAGEAVQFAPLKDYLRFRKEGFLEETLENVQHHVAAPDFDVDAVASGLTTKDREGRYLVSQPRLTLRLDVQAPSLKRGEVEAAGIEVGGKNEALNLEGAVGQRLTHELRLERRHPTRVRITLETTEGERATRELDVVYLPPPPVLEGIPPTRQTVYQEEYTLRLRAVPSVPTEAAELTQVQLGGEKFLVPPGADRFEQKVKLHRGQNELLVKARNRGALAEEPETSRSVFLIYEKEETPQAEFTAVEIAPGKAEAHRLKVEAAQIVSDGPHVRLLGKVKADKDLTLAEVRTTAGKTIQKLDAHGQEAAVDVPLNLEPGKVQELVLVAQTAHSDLRKETIRIVYHPLLPDLDLRTPRAGEVLNESRERTGPPEVEVTVSLTPPKDAYYPVRALVRVLGPEHGTEREVVIDRSSGDKPLSLGKVRLAHGDNRIQVRLANAWREGPPVEVPVSFRRPPFIRALTVADPGEHPVTSVLARIESPAGIDPTALSVNGRPFKPGDVAQASKPDERGLITWDVRIPNVGLQVQENEPIPVVLTVQTPDGKDSKEQTVRWHRPPPPKASILPRAPEVVREPRARLTIGVRSEKSRLQRVEVFLNGRLAQALDVKQQRDRDGTFSLEQDVELTGLKEQDNKVRIEAENDGGVEPRDLTITYVPLPVTLSVELPGPHVKDARIRLSGTIRWTRENEARAVAALGNLRTYVNGFRQQRPSELPRTNPQSRSFTIELRLNQPENEVRIECPGLPLDAGGQQHFRLTCDNPEKPSTLRVMIVNAGTKPIDEARLVEKALTALGVKREDTRSPKSRVFTQIISYPPGEPGAAQALTDYVRARKVKLYLDAMRQAIETEGSCNDVVLIYWVGREAVEKGNWYLLTSDVERQPGLELAGHALPLRDLLDADGEVPGARVVLLDVAPPARVGVGKAFDWEQEHTAVLRYAWSQKEGPLPGLLDALEQVARDGKKGSLQEVAAAAAGLHRDDLIDLTRSLADLANLVMVR